MNREEISKYLERAEPMFRGNQLVYSVSFVAEYQSKVNSYINQLEAEKKILEKDLENDRTVVEIYRKRLYKKTGQRVSLDEGNK